MNDSTNDRPEHTIRMLGDVPVYNCHVYLSAPNDRGIVQARVANLPQVAAQGNGERDALRNIVREFKATISGLASRGEPIPWLAESSPRRPDETQRFVPVHF